MCTIPGAAALCWQARSSLIGFHIFVLIALVLIVVPVIVPVMR
jgi:hypothetical protein